MPYEWERRAAGAHRVRLACLRPVPGTLHEVMTGAMAQERDERHPPFDASRSLRRILGHEHQPFDLHPDQPVFLIGGFTAGSEARPSKLAESLARGGYRVSVDRPGASGRTTEETIEGVERSGAFHRRMYWKPAASFASRRRHLPLARSDGLDLLPQRLDPGARTLSPAAIPATSRTGGSSPPTPHRPADCSTPFNYLTEAGFFVRRAVQKADGVFCPAHFLKEKVKRLYGLKILPSLLPNLIDVPAALPEKSDRPTLTFVARWDKRKRPWMFLELASMFPDYRFVAVGQGSASAESGFDARLRRRYRDVPNLEMPGLINRFREPERMHRLLSDTWVFVSTAVREGLPLTFLEAAAYGCPIVSSVDRINSPRNSGSKSSKTTMPARFEV